jgi:preprotein translocase subunit SecA
VLHEGKIAEMATGEGKTLMATLAAALNAFAGLGVHIVTVNDYLAQRDRDWMAPVYEGLGLTVGCIQSPMDPPERIPQYASDITYGTNNEFGFDYLRDNMKSRPEDLVQRRRTFAIVDEVDSVLVDEARTPLIISGMPEKRGDVYKHADEVARRLSLDQKSGDAGELFEVKEKEGQVILLEEGIERVERYLRERKVLKGASMYEGENSEWPHLIEQALRAHHLYKRDKEYIVERGEVVIIDEHTGRKMSGRRWSDGLHQAVEAKERVKTREESQTLATITFQNFFKLYDKLSGMTGTASTEAREFDRIYALPVVQIPTNKPNARVDHEDRIFKTREEKYKAIVARVKEINRAGRPVLIGTIAVERSEEISEFLTNIGLKHEVLNAKNHAREAEIIARAGEAGAITVATNMAGRGTDIKLAPGIVEKGGLFVVGTERHEARRIDNQLRGRCARQGDAGETEFYLSLEDDLMRIFARGMAGGVLRKFGFSDGEITHPWVTKSIATAQKRVEARNYEIRKNLKEYDQVMNDQRKVIYTERENVLLGNGVREMVVDKIRSAVDQVVTAPFEFEGDHADRITAWRKDLELRYERMLGFPAPPDSPWGGRESDLRDHLCAYAETKYGERVAEIGPDIMGHIERHILLDAIDSQWKDHLYAMDFLRSAVRAETIGGGTQDPKNEYQKRGFEYFRKMLEGIDRRIASTMFRVRPVDEAEEAERQRQIQSRWANATERHDAAQAFAGETSGAMADAAGRQQGDQKGVTYVRKERKVGPNEPCPCGAKKSSGAPVKYKECHGA